MSDDEIVGVIGLDAPTGGLPPMTQCTGCGRFIDGRCSVCPPAEVSRPYAFDPDEYERQRNRRRREDLLSAARPGERI